jgi:hypothetical protein
MFPMSGCSSEKALCLQNKNIIVMGQVKAKGKLKPAIRN